MLLLTTSRKGADKSPARQRMVKVLKQRKNQRLYKRGVAVIPQKTR
jgi:hypothetical protein